MGQRIKNIELQHAVSKRLKNFREDKSLSQEIVYNDTSIHIARIETGNHNISVSTLQILCKYYSTTLQEFFADGFDDVQKEM